MAGLLALLTLVTAAGLVGITASLVYALKGWSRAATQTQLALDRERECEDCEGRHRARPGGIAAADRAGECAVV